MLDYKDLRQKLNSKISQISLDKSYKNKVINNCHHDFKKYKQTIIPSNYNFNKHAYFVVLACDKCKEKKIIDYRVEL